MTDQGEMFAPQPPEVRDRKTFLLGGRVNRGEPDFDLDAAIGAQGELFVSDLRRALAEGRVEVKKDMGFTDTGNIYVETACHYPGRGTKPTGVANPDTAPLWVYVLGDTGAAVVFDIATLRRLGEHPIARPSSCTRGSHETDGYLLPLRKVFTRGVL